MKPGNTLLRLIPIWLVSTAMIVFSLLCMLSAYSFPVNSRILLLFTLAVTGAFTAAFSFRRRYISLPLILLTLSFLFYRNWGRILNGAKIILNELFFQWKHSYSFIPNVTFEAQGGAMEITLFCMLLAALAALLIGFSLCYFRITLPAIAAILPGFIVSVTLIGFSPKPAYLVGLVACCALLALSSATRMHNAAGGGKLLLYLSLPVLLACFVLYLHAPEDNYTRSTFPNRLWEWLSGESYELYMQHSRSGGSPEARNLQAMQVDFSTLGEIDPSSTPMLRAEPDRSGVVYLRGYAVSSYDGRAWSVSSNAYTSDGLNFCTVDSGTDMQNIRLELLAPSPRLYLPYYSCREQEGLNLEAAFSRQGFFENKENLTQYTVQAVPHQSVSLPSVSMRQNGQAASFLTDYTALPGNTRQQVSLFLSEHGLLSDDTVQTAERIAAYLQQNGSYTLDSEIMPIGSDFVPWFLEQSMAGYCVHFASCGAVMLRAAGIPARYVTGFMGYCEGGVENTLTGKNAHAWVEYYLDGFGWVLLECTPSDGQPPQAETGTEEQTDETATGELRPSEQAQTEPTVSDAESLDPTTPTQQPSQEQSTAPKDARSWWIPVSVLALLLAIVLLRRKFVLRRRQKKRSAAGNNARAVLIWEHILTVCKHLHCQPDPAMQALAHKARFSQHRLDDDAVRQLEDYEGTLLRKLHHSSSFPKRLYCRWICLVDN